MKQKKFGSIRVLKSGRVQARYTLRTGEQVTAGTFKSVWDAQVRLDEIEVDLRREEHWDGRKGKTKFRDFMGKYMKRRARKVSPGELANNKSYLKVHLLPAFGNLRMEEIDEELVDAWFDAQPPSETRRNVYAFLRRAMRFAVKWKYIRSSPCNVLEPSECNSPPRPTWTQSDFRRVLAHVPETIRVNNAKTPTRIYYREALEIMFSAHLRLGELVALNASDYNRKSGTLRIERQVTGLGYTTATKTGVNAELHLLEVGISAINRLPVGIGAVPLIPGAISPRLPRASLQKAWRRATVEAGFENFHIHDIRHIGLTMVANSGLTTKDVMARGRHKSLQSSLRYQHTDADRDREIAERVNRMLEGKRAEGTGTD